VRLGRVPFHKRTSVTEIRITLKITSNLDNSEELISELMIQYNYNKFIFNYDKYIIKCKATNRSITGMKTTKGSLQSQKNMWEKNIKIQNCDFFIPSYIIIPDILEIMYKFKYDALYYFLNPEKINKEIINNDYINDVNFFFTRIKDIYYNLLNNEIYVIDFKLENVAYYVEGWGAMEDPPSGGSGGAVVDPPIGGRWVLIDNDMIVDVKIIQEIPSDKIAMTWKIGEEDGDGNLSIDLYKSMITAFFMELLIILIIYITNNNITHKNISNIRHNSSYYKIDDLVSTIENFIIDNLASEYKVDHGDGLVSIQYSKFKNLKKTKKFIQNYFKLFSKCVNNRTEFTNLNVKETIINKYLKL